MIIILEGLAGSGKTSTAIKLAESLDYSFLDSGKMYRIFAKYLLSHNTPLQPKDVYSSLQSFLAEFGESKLIEGMMATDLNSPEITRVTSYVGSAYFVRKRINQLLIQIINEANQDVVLTGRNLEHDLSLENVKTIYLHVSSEERAKRRWKERVDLDPLNSPTLEETVAEIIERDRRDSERKVSPFVVSENAVWLDVEKMTLEQVVSQIILIVTSEVSVKHEYEGRRLVERR